MSFDLYLLYLVHPSLREWGGGVRTLVPSISRRKVYFAQDACTTWCIHRFASGNSHVLVSPVGRHGAGRDIITVQACTHVLIRTVYR